MVWLEAKRIISSTKDGIKDDERTGNIQVDKSNKGLERHGLFVC